MSTMFESDTTTAATEPSELDAFKALVRRKARAAKRQQGWDTAKMNAVLVELGLEPVPSYAIEVPVTATATFRYELGDSYTQESAESERARIARCTDTDLLGNISYRNYTITERAEPKLVVAVGVEGAEQAEEAKTDDLAAYKKYVRKVSIRVANENGWCDSGLNDYLGQMGLPLKQTHYVTVEVPLTQRVSLAVAEAETAEEARELLAAGGEDVERLVKEQLGANVKLNGAPVLPEPGVPQAGDRPDPTYDTAARRFRADDTTAGRCRHVGPTRQYHCTLERGHSGVHVAGNGTSVAEVWPDSESTRRV